MDSEIINQELNNNELIIVFDRNKERTELNSFGNNPRESFYFKREDFDPPFDDPNLHISVFHGLDQDTIQIKRRELDKMIVWFDSEMGYMDWFRLNYEKYYIIYQDEYLVKGSLNPEHKFTAYEVKIHTGGVE
ncbi:hypothetical protein Ataiwa_01330 [Algoriphagus taiwanensis]|uniref:Phage tail protein n=2 Tax=Algoriphagus taiwanensis TaxID=1445656 RepID=A0ABQ6PW38_9BACT|nr:hypothetical protein Ataiwa_01330 [Algoriphagus taiwanensis]